MNIVIATGIYPPEIGGPSEYARQLFETLLIQNHTVVVSTYGDLKRLPSGLRHFMYFCRLFVEAWDADYIIALDTFSVALPATFFAKIFRKKIVMRVAGDFLWESYIERTRESVLLSQFYMSPRKYTVKERIIFFITRFLLHTVDGIVFSTEWQRTIWHVPYMLPLEKTYIIENMYPSVDTRPRTPTEPKVFLSPSRDRVIKNKKNLEKAFGQVATEMHQEHPGIVLDTTVVSREVLLEKIQHAYAVIVPSYSEVSPNLIFDALQYNVPVIATRDVGIKNRLAGLVVFVDPLSVVDIKRGILTLLDPSIYDAYTRKIMQNTHTHTWNEIADEFLGVYREL